MKPLRAKPVVFLCVGVLAFFLGCARRKTVPPPPPPNPAPESTPQPPPPLPPASSQAQLPTQGTPPPSLEAPAPAAENPEKAKVETVKPRPPAKKANAPVSNNRRNAEAARNLPPRTVVRPESSEPAPVPGVISPNPSQSGARDPAATEQLLASTETNLTTIKRRLSRDEEAMVAQIKDFVGQSRQAIKENDLVRAHNLALKAYLLCDDLVKRR